MIHTIEVTADDIARGRRGNCELCPVALAINRAIPCPDGFHWEILQVTAAMVADDDRFDRRSFRLPVEVCDLITFYDFNDPVQPLTFTLEV